MSYQPEPCPRCKGSGIEPFPAGVTHQIGAPSCMACWGTGKKDSDLTARALMMSGRLYGEIHGTSNTEQAATRTAEQSHLVALAERDALTAERDTLAAWKAEALPLLDQWTKVWVALDKPGQLGDSLAASSLAEVHALTAQVEALTAQRDEAVRLLRDVITGACWCPNCASDHNPEALGDVREFLRGVDQ